MLLSIVKSKLGKILLPILLLTSLLFLVGCYSSAPSQGWTGPTVYNGVLYVGTIENKIIALDASNGEKLQWEKPLEGGIEGSFGCSHRYAKPMSTYGTPWVENGVVYLGEYDGNVIAIDAETEMSSTFTTGGAIVGSPVVDNGTVFIGSSDGKLYALSADNIENKKWEFETGGKIWATPAVYNGVVYIGSTDHRLYALDAETGKEIWHFEAEASVLCTPLVSDDTDGTVYIGDCDNKFYAIDAVSDDEKQAAIDRGEEEQAPAKEAKWVFDKAENWFWTKALLYNGEIWVGNLDHKVYAINAQDPEDFQVVLETQGRVRTPPVLVKGKIIVGSEDGNIYTIDPETKDSTTLRSLETPILAPIFADADNGVIYVHAQDGTHILYAINVETGDEIWHFNTDATE